MALDSCLKDYGRKWFGVGAAMSRGGEDVGEFPGVCFH
jgi:hypothetical protein